MSKTPKQPPKCTDCQTQNAPFIYKDCQLCGICNDAHKLARRYPPPEVKVMA